MCFNLVGQKYTHKKIFVVFEMVFILGPFKLKQILRDSAGHITTKKCYNISTMCFSQCILSYEGYWAENKWLLTYSYIYTWANTSSLSWHISSICHHICLSHIMIQHISSSPPTSDVPFHHQWATSSCWATPPPMSHHVSKEPPHLYGSTTSSMRYKISKIHHSSLSHLT